MQVAAIRLASFGLLTGFGWALVNSVELRSVPKASSAIPDKALQAVAGNPAAIPSGSLSATTVSTESPQPFQLQPALPVAIASNTSEQSGTSIRLNSHTLPGRWQQKNGRIGVSSAALSKLVGVELLNAADPTQQSVRWFPSTQDETITLPAWWDSTDRYLDISDLASRAGWTGQAAGNTLQLNLPQSRVGGIRQGKQTWGDRIVVDLTGPATWQMESADVYTVSIDGAITPQMVRAFRAISGNLLTQLHVAPLNGRTVLKIRTKDGASPQIWSTGSPSRIVIDIRKDAMVERDVAWAPGLRWRQQYIAVGTHRFPVYMFIVQPNPATLSLRPIHAKPNSAIGIEPILTQAQTQRVAAAVNAGFFNRNNQLPLGALRRDSQWISGPILGRGAMAWNEQGDLIMDRLVLSEVARTESGEAFPILAMNSGYVQAGIGRYTPGWGSSYTPIVDSEVVVTVRNGSISNKRTMGKAGSGNIAIPSDGYLLAFRSNNGASEKFVTGQLVSLDAQSQPSAFDQYPNVVGGGPLLIRDRNVVLNPQLEGFSTNFIQGSAPRTAVGKLADGSWVIATMHDRVNGRGPTLRETAQIMQQLGAVDALNLDGGSSSSLYLGGQLLNRQPRTAARVNNGIGLFVLGRD